MSARSAWQGALLVLGLALLTSRGLDTADAAVHLDLAVAIVERGETTLSIEPGELWVPAHPVAGGLFYQADDGLRSASAPGHAWLAVPVVAASSALARAPAPSFDRLFAGGPAAALRPLQRDPRVLAFALIGPISAAIAVAFLVLAARALRLSRAAILAGACALAAGSPLLGYAGTCWTQLPSAAALSIVLHGLCAREARASVPVWPVGLASAAAVVLRPEHLVYAVAAALALYSLDRSWRRAPSRAMARFVAPVAIAVGLLAWWGLPQAGDGWSLAELPRGVVGLLASPRTGLLVYAPFVAFVPAGLWALRGTRRPIAVYVVAVTLASLLVYGGWFDWGASIAHGPRFLVPILPALALAFAVGFDAMRAAGRAAAVVAIGAGVLIWLPGALVLHARLEEPESLLHPSFVSAWEVLLGGGPIDCVSTFVPAFPALALCTAAVGLAISARRSGRVSPSV